MPEKRIDTIKKQLKEMYEESKAKTDALKKALDALLALDNDKDRVNDTDGYAKWVKVDDLVTVKKNSFFGGTSAIVVKQTFADTAVDILSSNDRPLRIGEFREIYLARTGNTNMKAKDISSRMHLAEKADDRIKKVWIDKVQYWALSQWMMSPDRLYNSYEEKILI